MRFNLPLAVAALSSLNLGVHSLGYNASHNAFSAADPSDSSAFLKDDGELDTRQLRTCDDGFTKCGTRCCPDGNECCGLNCCESGAVCTDRVCCLPEETACGLRCCPDGSHCDDGLCYEGDDGRGFSEILPAAQIATLLAGGWTAWWMTRG